MLKALVRELKSLTKYRFSLIQDCAALKTSYARLCTILFLELKKLVPSLHMASVYTLLMELPNASTIAGCLLTHLSHLLPCASKEQYGKDKAVKIRNAASISIGSFNEVKSLKLQQTILLIEIMKTQIAQVEARINPFVDSLHSPIMTVSGISYRMAAIIIAKTENFTNSISAEQVLAYVGLKPSVYQSGQMTSTHCGSKYLHYALFNATKYVCRWDEHFGTYFAKKRQKVKRTMLLFPMLRRS